MDVYSLEISSKASLNQIAPVDGSATPFAHSEADLSVLVPVMIFVAYANSRGLFPGALRTC